MKVVLAQVVQGHVITGQNLVGIYTDELDEFEDWLAAMCPDYVLHNLRYDHTNMIMWRLNLAVNLRDLSTIKLIWGGPSTKTNDC
jgi:hypothetical protein